MGDFEENSSLSKKHKASEMSPAINPSKASALVGPKPIKRSHAFSGSGGLSGNWRAKVNHSKHLQSALCYGTPCNIFPKFPRNAAALQPLQVRQVVSLTAVATVKRGHCQSQASSATTSPPKSRNK